MRLSLKAKLTALITVLVLLVVVGTSTVYISNLTRQALLEVQAKANMLRTRFITRRIRRWRGSRMPEGENPQDLQALRNVVQTQLSSDPRPEVADGIGGGIFPGGRLRRHHRHQFGGSGPQQFRGSRPTPYARRRPYSQILRQGDADASISTVFGPPRVYEVTLPLAIGPKPLGTCGWAFRRFCCAMRSGRIFAPRCCCR